MKYKLICAVCRGGGIGKDGRLPWKIKEDLEFFSKLTKGKGNNAVVMGRKTWESIGSKPLPGRDNLIMSRSTRGKSSKGSWFSSIDEIDAHCAKKKYDQVWVIGGAQIYKDFLDANKIDAACVTYIDQVFDCDTQFPQFPSGWQLTARLPMLTTQPYGVEIRRLIMIE